MNIVDQVKDKLKAFDRKNVFRMNFFLLLMMPIVAFWFFWNWVASSIVPIPHVTLLQVVVGYSVFYLFRVDAVLVHATNISVKFVGLPFALGLAWGTVLPKFWETAPVLSLKEVWLGYIGLYALATVLSQVFNPKQVL